MNICFDVGNSTIGIGVYENDILKERMTFNTDVKLTEDEFYHLFKNKINELNDEDFEYSTSTSINSVENTQERWCNRIKRRRT